MSTPGDTIFRHHRGISKAMFTQTRWKPIENCRMMRQACILVERRSTVYGQMGDAHGKLSNDETNLHSCGEALHSIRQNGGRPSKYTCLRKNQFHHDVCLTSCDTNTPYDQTNNWNTNYTQQHTTDNDTDLQIYCETNRHIRDMCSGSRFTWYPYTYIYIYYISTDPFRFESVGYPFHQHIDIPPKCSPRVTKWTP